jgi:MFS superfamily sulfate permease-like transporter
VVYLIIDILKFIWRYFDVICFLAAIFFAVWGFFLLSFVAGIFSIAMGLIILGFIAERIANSLQ